MSSRQIGLDSLSIVPAGGNSQPTKKWQIVAIIIGSLVVVGAGVFGATGLLHSHGIISLPQEFASAIGSINDTSLILISSSGLVLGASLIALGNRGGKKQTSISIPRSSNRLHQISWGLKAPSQWCLRTSISLIYPLQSMDALQQKTRCQIIFEIAKRICKVIAVLIAIIPACLFYGLGALSSYLFDTPRIKTHMLHLAPPPPNPLRTDLTCDLNILKTWFRREKVSPKNQESFDRMIDCIRKRDERLLETYHLPPFFYDDMALYLQNIIELIVSHPDKKDILENLGEAAVVCPPTWYETAKKQYRSLNGTGFESELLHWIQDMKEQIILKLAQNTFDTEWHALNYVRFHVGKELGLNDDASVNDPYFEQIEHASFTKSFMINLFRAHFHAKDVISVIQMKVNAKYEVGFYDILKNAIAKCGIQDANAYVAENFYEDDSTTMNRNGVIMLLKIIGILV